MEEVDPPCQENLVPPDENLPSESPQDYGTKAVDEDLHCNSEILITELLEVEEGEDGKITDETGEQDASMAG